MNHIFSHARVSKRRGAVLLIAILVASVALAVGLGIYNRTYKQIYFALFWKQTQVALSAAEAGLECVLRADVKALASVTCFGNTFNYTAAWPIAPATQTVWNTPDLNYVGGCSKVTVTKMTAPATTTIIQARGYNDTCASTNPRRLERGLRVLY